VTEVQQSGGESAGTPRSFEKKTVKVRGLGRVYEREGGTWWVQYSYRGRFYRESSGTKSQAKAVKLLKRRLGEIGQGRLAGLDVERTTFENLAEMLIDDYKVNGRKSLDRAQRSIKHLGEFFERTRAIEITCDRVSGYIRTRLENAKPATVRNELAALKRMFTLGLRAERVSHRPQFPSISVQNARTGFFEESELQAVLVKLPEHARPLVEFLALTGWRVSEAKSLRWAQVDQVGGVVRLEVGSTKTGAGRVFPFAALPPLATLLRTQRERTSALERERGVLCPWVFHRNGKPISSFRDTWLVACQGAEVEGRLVHDLRRTAARNLVRSGVPERTAMALMGHKTRSIFDRYNIVSESDLADGVRKLAAFKTTELTEPWRVVALSREQNSRTSTEEARFADEQPDAGRGPCS
jgi:integrase